ncbi:CRISPR-associated endoribonuclease Cas6 [Emticicia sp. 17c]|uniref:CRISPR-associated endoribonuclease Cas6 n=1 Tax=Emticicia sp. 17c TaxID=3127704 RepID=UPI00301D16CC
MRFTLTLLPLNHPPQLMWNYHYPLASWLYNVIAKADDTYATFLHEKGYQTKQGKVFKHFTFSDLQAKIKFDKGDSGFQIVSPTVQWTVSFYIDRAAEKFIIGLFQNQTIHLFNREYNASFKVERVEILPQATCTNTTHFRATSAMVIAEKIDGVDKYLEPTNENFGQLLITGLIDKYLSVLKEKGEKIKPDIISQEIRFELLDKSKIRSRKITIKENKEEATDIKGYRDFTFALTGPKEVIEVGLLGGFGRYCSEGFGFCEVIA